MQGGPSRTNAIGAEMLGFMTDIASTRHGALDSGVQTNAGIATVAIAGFEAP